MNRPTFGERLQAAKRRQQYARRTRRPPVGVLVLLSMVIAGAGIAALQLGDDTADLVVYAVWCCWVAILAAYALAHGTTIGGAL